MGQGAATLLHAGSREWSFLATDPNMVKEENPPSPLVIK